ncbi:MAG: hypothetical protein EA352_06540 [Gemmatimonadales bacterium]|nr:MAG: hypothetical protein EA352_06540 [Gemmatimonadales bacterium]
MGQRPIYSREELAAIRAAFQTEAPVNCPRCLVELESNPVPRPTAVSYVRHRLWLLCPGCGRSAVVDRPRD